MHDHDTQGNGMMWMMVLCCALPVLFLVFLGGKAVGNSAWLILGAMAVVMAVHFFMMKRSHDQSDNDPNNKDKDNSRTGHSCH